MYKYFIGCLFLMACDSSVERQQRAIADSLHKEDSLLARYVMNNLGNQVSQHVRTDSTVETDTIKGTFVLPVLSKDLRNKKPEVVVPKDTCEE